MSIKAPSYSEVREQVPFARDGVGVAQRVDDFPVNHQVVAVGDARRET
jgi:hypothetical protein